MKLKLGSTPKVFISHSTKDQSFIEEYLRPALHRHGVETWYSSDDIHTAQKWERMIKKGLEECPWFLVVLTENAVKSRWVRIEVGWAFENRGENHVIPLMLRNCKRSDIHLELGTIQYVDFRKDKNRGLRDLLKTWGKDFTADDIEENEFLRDDIRNKDFIPADSKRKGEIPFWKTGLLAASIILIILLAITVWILSIKASNNKEDLATIRLANYYYSKGLDSNVITVVQPLAIKGDTEALKLLGNSQYNIGFALYNKKELKQSFDFFNKSVAANNNAQAECMLGIMYYWGQGGAQTDYKQALEWLVKSSDQKNDYARLWIGIFYMKGYGVKKDSDSASKYFNWVIKNGSMATRDEAAKNLAKLNQN